MIYIIAAHVGFKNGKEAFGLTTHITQFFEQKKYKYAYIKHSLEGSTSSQIVDKIEERGVFTTNLSKFHNKNLAIRSLESIILNLLYISKLKRVYPSESICMIGVNPLNAISGVILRKLNFVDKLYFLSADYAVARFPNHVSNFIYQLLDRNSARNADKVMCVSSRILSLRKKQGILKNKLFLFPNSPFYNLVPKKNIKKIGTDLVVVTHFNKSFDIKLLVSLLEILNMNKNIFKLKIIGYGPEEFKIRSAVSRSSQRNQILFLGQLTHAEVLKTISKSFLGIALYTNENPWVKFGDSMKAREYMAAGVPVIINSIPSTSDEVAHYRSGFVIEDNTPIRIIAEFIQKCRSNHTFYLQLHANALNTGKIFDKEKILNKLFK